MLELLLKFVTHPSPTCVAVVVVVVTTITILCNRKQRKEDEALFKESPPREECPICMLPLPHNGNTYKACCGKTVCNGCMWGNIVHNLEDGPGQVLCPFCRTMQTNDFAREVRMLNERMAANDAGAFAQLGECYRHGQMGLQENHVRALELCTRAADLGSIEAHKSLGDYYYHGRGTPRDVMKAKHHWEIAAMKGNAAARHHLGVFEIDVRRDMNRAFKHFMIAAKDGYSDSMQNTRRGYSLGRVTKEELEETLRAHQKSLDEMK